MSLHALPSLRQPDSLHPDFYFTSSVFLAKITADLDRLLAGWLIECEAGVALSRSAARPRSHLSESSAGLGGLGGGPGSGEGPFKKFKKVYKRLGWIYVHLSVADVALRKAWFRQIGVVFGLWCFWGTQPDVLGPRHYIVVDTLMYQYIRSIPNKLGGVLDEKYGAVVDSWVSEPSSSTGGGSATVPLVDKHRAHLDPNLFDPAPPAAHQAPEQLAKPSDSLYQVVANLVAQDAFVIEPDQTALAYPPLPSNTLLPEEAHAAVSSSSTSIPATSKPKKRNHLGELILSAKNELSRSANDTDRWNHSELDKTRSTYLCTKGILNSFSGESEPIISSILHEAIGMTRKVIQKTGPGLDHLLFPISSNELDDESSASQSKHALFLVDSGSSLNELHNAINSLKADNLSS